MTYTIGDTGDISNLAEFGWYDWVWFIGPEDSDMLNIRMGKYLGPSFDIGEAVTAKILTDKGKTVHRTSVFPITGDEQRSKAFTAKSAKFGESLAAHVGARQVNSPDGV